MISLHFESLGNMQIIGVDAMKARYCMMAVSVGVVLTLGGCTNKLLDPGQIGRFQATPAINIILESLGVAEETPIAWENGEDPRPEDAVAAENDFTLGAGDRLRVQIFELYAEGHMAVNEFVVNETGKISIPDVGIITVAGLTETQLEGHIKEVLTPSILRRPSVAVTLLDSQRRTCSVIGDGVDVPGRQIIPRMQNGYRLIDALSMARGPHQTYVSYVYVTRAATPRSSLTTRRPVPAQPMARLSEPSRSVAVPHQTTPVTQISQPVPPTHTYAQARPFKQPFNQERQMLGMATPMMRRMWDESEKVMTSSIFPKSREPLEVISPSSFQRPKGDSRQFAANTGQGAGVESGTPQINTAGGDIEWVFENGKWIAVTRTPAAQPQRQPQPRQPQPPSRPRPQVQPQPGPTPRPLTEAPAPVRSPQLEWIFEDGKWIAVEVDTPPTPVVPTGPPAQTPRAAPLDTQPSPLRTGSWEAATQRRLIKIPVGPLLDGDHRYNIVIKPGDTIHVPLDMVGECFISGHVNKTGPISLYGRRMTLKMAVAAAGDLGPLAFPKLCEVVRRIGRNREEIVLVDLEKIASGEQPDFIIKHNDLIRVGTHFTSRWRAVVRNAFRAAYGFGFVYDRNFADADYGTGFPQWF
jgi:protein involved in polysaccharide export with SLBB domain